NAGAVYLFSGRDGHLMRRLGGSEACAQFGQSVATMDLPGMPYGVLVVAAPGATPSSPRENAGSIFMYDSSSGALLRRLDGPAAYMVVGSSLATADVNRDGTPDVIAGAPGCGLGLGRPAGNVVVFSGKDGTVLLN